MGATTATSTERPLTFRGPIHCHFRSLNGDAALVFQRPVPLQPPLETHQVRRHAPGSLLVFLMPPSLEELERRLRERGMAEEEIKLRLGNAQGEIAESAKYDYIVLNDRLDHAVAQMREILQKERRERSAK